MPRLSVEDQLKKAEQDRADAERRFNEAKSKLDKKQRAEDTRRKIVIGAMLLKDCESDDPNIQKRGVLKWLRYKLPQMTKRDRELFAEFEDRTTSQEDAQDINGR